jgi:hypothetical protein
VTGGHSTREKMTAERGRWGNEYNSYFLEKLIVINKL